VLTSKLEELVALGMARPDIDPDDDGDLAPFIPARAVEAKTQPDPAPVAARDAAQHAEPEIPEVEARIEKPTKRGSVPDTAKPLAKRAAEPTAPATSPKTRPARTAGDASGSKKSAVAEARVFVPSHAPDDPGPDEVEPDDITVPLRPQRA
jgi:hypothetical protein